MDDSEGSASPPPPPHLLQPWAVPPVTGWPAAPPPSRDVVQIIAVVLAVTVPVLVAAVVAALVLGPRLLNARDDAGTPAVGGCYIGSESTNDFNGDADTDTLIPCAEKHIFETIASGKVRAAVRPARGSATARDLWNNCLTAAENFLGAPYRATLTMLALAVPSTSAWNAGAHWYRCDLASVATVDSDNPVSVKGPLKGTVDVITCLSWSVVDGGTAIGTVVPTDCDTVHNGELTAATTLADDVDWNDQDALTRAAGDLCYPKTADFLGGTSVRDELKGWMFSPTEEERLDRSVLCLVAARDLNLKFTASLKGIGSGPIPFA